MSIKVAAYAAQSAESGLASFSIDRREPDADDVAIDLLYCGVCHTDLHFVRNDFGMTVYPLVPGHEMVGRVSSVGTGVTKFAQGDLVAVGCLVDSCRTCASCNEGLEQYCDNGFENGSVATYGGVDYRHGNEITMGGYSRHIVVNQGYVLRVPDGLDPAGAAPLLCAGISTWSPLKEWNVGPGMKVGVIGLGGLGHMGVKLAHALGAHVVMITTSPEKGADAERLGADEVLISKDPEAMMAHADSFDFLLDTIPVGHAIDPYVMLLKRDATLALVGAVEPMESFNNMFLALRRRRVAGTMIGGIKETQEMLDFCGEHNVIADIELIKAEDIEHAFERMEKADVKYRFVIDLETMADAN